MTTNIDGTRVLAGVTCPSSTLCLAGEARGRVLASQHPLSGAAAWHATRIDVPSETDRDTETDNSVVPFCASSTLCVAADVLGRVFVSEHPGADAPHWRNRTPLDTEGNYNAGTCPRPSLCVMVDGNGSAWNTTQPAAGGWHNAGTGRFVATALTGKVQCASSSLCLMLTDNGMYASTHPAARRLWQHQPLPFKLAAVACPVRSFCAGIAPAEVRTTTNPLGGRGAWRLTDVDPGNDLTGAINCDSSRLCAAVDGSGNVVTSNNPTRGRHAWHKTHLGGHGLHGVSWSGVACPTPTVCLVDSGESNKLATLTLAGHTVSWAFSTLPAGLDLADLACPSSALCVAVAGPGDSGQLASNANPTGGGPWTLTTVDAQPITNVSCPSARFCAAVDQDGRLITSRRLGG